MDYPQVYSSPLLVMAALCELPQPMSRTRLFFRASIRRGLSMLIISIIVTVDCDCDWTGLELLPDPGAVAELAVVPLAPGEHPAVHRESHGVLAAAVHRHLH